MLYPIELLGQMTPIAPRGAATDGVHVNDQGGVCHVVLRLFECRAKPMPKITVSSRKHGHLRQSCKMHSPKMPALQIATFQALKVHSSH